MRKMVQPCCWFLQLILLCQLFQLGTPLRGGTQHSSLGIHQEGIASEEDIGEIVFFLLYILIVEIGKKLDKGYRCPVYCEVKHEHIYYEEKSNIQTDDRIPRSDESKDREQPESSLRPIASAD